MYCLEGQLVVRRDPETLLGQYGCYYVDEQPTVDNQGVLGAHRSTISRTGDEDYVLTARELLIRAGELPEDTPVELITSIDQAEKYTPPVKKELRVVRHRLGNLGVLLDVSIPQGIELLEGTARLWKDRRYPTPYIYLLARGALLAEVEYDQALGWGHVYDQIEGSRNIKGIASPVAYKTKTQYKTKGTSRDGYNFSETISEGTIRSSGYHINVGFRWGKR